MPDDQPVPEVEASEAQPFEGNGMTYAGLFPAVGDSSTLSSTISSAAVFRQENLFYQNFEFGQHNSPYQLASFRPENVPQRINRDSYDPNKPLGEQRHLFPPRQGPNHPEYDVSQPLENQPHLFEEGFGPNHPKFIPGMPLELQLQTLSPDYDVDPGQISDVLPKLESGDANALSKIVRDFMKYARGEMRTEQDYLNGVKAMEALNYLRGQGIEMDFNIQEGTIKMTTPTPDGGNREITIDRDGLTRPRGERQNFANDLAKYLKGESRESQPAECTDLLQRIESGDPEALKEITRVLTSPNAFMGGPRVEKALSVLQHLAERGINVSLGNNGTITFSMTDGNGHTSEMTVGRDGSLTRQGSPLQRSAVDNFMQKFRARAILDGSRANCPT